MKTIRQFHLEAHNDKTGRAVRLTASPLPHSEACVMKSKFNPSQYVRIVLVQVSA